MEETLLHIREASFGFWSWLALVLMFVTVLHLPYVRKFLGLLLWPVRFPIMVVGYIVIFVLYAVLKVVDPRGVDVSVLTMTGEPRNHFMTKRLLHSFLLGYRVRRMSMYDFHQIRTQDEDRFNARGFNERKDKGLRTLTQRLQYYIQTKNNLS